MAERPYKRSIWCHDKRYALDPSAITPVDLDVMARLASVDAAKKQIPPIPGQQLLAIAAAARAMPSPASVTEELVSGFLIAGLRHHGAGIATLICMLAVVSDGAYAPMDRKVAVGLGVLGKLAPSETAVLTGRCIPEFARVYVQKVLPAWMEIRQSMSAEDADNYLGSKAGAARSRLEETGTT